MNIFSHTVHYIKELIDNTRIFQWPLGVATYRNFPAEIDDYTAMGPSGPKRRSKLFNFMATVCILYNWEYSQSVCVCAYVHKHTHTHTCTHIRMLLILFSLSFLSPLDYRSTKTHQEKCSWILLKRAFFLASRF